MERSPDRLRELMQAYAVPNNFAFLPHRRVIPVGAAPAPAGKQTVMIDGAVYWISDLLTMCNSYVSIFTAALGCCIPPLKANDQIQKYLDANEGKMAGWFNVNRTAAIERAKLGYPTVMGATAAGHGHIGIVMPSPATDPSTVYVSAAGRTNIAYDKATKSFGVALDATARFWTHN